MLTDADREALDSILIALWQCETDAGYEHMRAKVNAAVEAIVAAHVTAALNAAADELKERGQMQPTPIARLTYENAARFIYGRATQVSRRSQVSP